MQEFNVSSFLRILGERKRFLLVIVTLCVLIGIVVALTTPRVYTSNIELIAIEPSTSKTSLGGLGGLVGLAGVNFGASETGDLSPEIYTNILRSTLFLLDLREKKFYHPLAIDSIKLSTYDSEYGKRSLLSRVLKVPGTIVSLVRGASSNSDVPLLSSKKANLESKIFQIGIAERQFLISLMSSIQVSFNDENGITSIAALHQDPIISAQMVQFTYEYLTAFLESHKSAQQRKKLSFIERQLILKKSEFENLQHELAVLKDKNVGVSTNMARTALDNLQSEHDLAFSLVSSLSQQREEAAIRLEEKSGVFKVLEPVVVPVSPTKPNRKLIVIGFLFLGIFLGVSIVFGRKLIGAYGLKLAENSRLEQ